MKDLSYLNEYRVDLWGDGYLGDKHNGAFQMSIRGKLYFIMASDGLGWEHVSVSHKAYMPTWEVMCEVKDLFFDEEEAVMQLHPKHSEYVNYHKNCLHLWKPVGQEIPTPPFILVGPKTGK